MIKPRFLLLILAILATSALFNCSAQPMTSKNTGGYMTGDSRSDGGAKDTIAEKEEVYIDENGNEIVMTPEDREKYKNYGENPRTSPLTMPFSTFSIDVDTGSYTNGRRYLNYGQLPPEDSVRVEEYVNYFDYDYQVPDHAPFTINQELATSPFDAGRMLLKIGIQGKKIKTEQRPPVNLVFLIDVSGSMNSDDKLGLLKSSFKLLTDQLTEKDRISMVVYAGAAGCVLEPTSGAAKNKILDALNKLKAGGSTNGGEGILLAYKKAESAFIKDGINRIILASDGDFNVGVSSHDDLVKMVEEKRKNGVSLTILGLGSGNLNDRTMEQLANKGNGNYFYIDNINEAKKVLVDELSATLQIIAKDVKIQVEFNPKYVFSYRLIGYENRKLKKEEFDDDTIDAGEIGAGHRVTAFYELTMTDSKYAKEGGSRYEKEGEEIKEGINKSSTAFKDEIAFFRLRFKPPDGDKSDLIEKALLFSEVVSGEPSSDFLFASGVAHFAQLLRKSEFTSSYAYDDVLKVLKESKGKDPWGYRAECIKLVEKAKELSKQ